MLPSIIFSVSTNEPVYAQWEANNTIDAGGGRTARLVQNLMLQSEVDAMIEVISTAATDLEKLDSTDGLPAFETYVLNDGKPLHPVVTSQLQPLVERVTEHTRSDTSYGCPECHLCSLLLRRYRQSERVRVHSHFDRNAIVTAVASLNGMSPRDSNPRASTLPTLKDDGESHVRTLS